MDFSKTSMGPPLAPVAGLPPKSAISASLSAGRTRAIDPSLHPWRAIARLEFRELGMATCVGSGFLVRPDMVLSASHNIKRAGKFSEIEIILGCDRKLGLGRTLKVERYGWHGAHDLALFQVTPTTVEPLPIGIPGEGVVTLAAYPDMNEQLLLGSARLTIAGQEGIYELNARPGDSGGPVLIQHQGQPRVACVHLRNSIKPAKQGPPRNFGIGRIIDPAFQAAVIELENFVRAGGR